MIDVTEAFRNELDSGNRKYIVSAVLYTSTQTYTITNSSIWENTFFIEDAVTQSGLFDIGTAVINKLTLGLNNITEAYSNVDFKNALIIPQVGLIISGTGEVEQYQKGIFIVDDVIYDGSVIRLTCLDLMAMFDRKYTTELTFPATLADIVEEACDVCGVTINGTKYPTAPATFRNNDYVVSKKPERDDLTFREVISWCATIAGCFARVSRLGALEFSWFNIATLADLIQNMHAPDLPVYPGVDYLLDNFSADVAVTPTSIRCVQLSYTVTDADGNTETKTETYGDTSGYKVSVANNDFITTDAQASTVVSAMSSALYYMIFYRADITHVSDPTIEAGDIAMVRNFRGKMYPIIVSRTKFGISTSQVTNSNSETELKNVLARPTLNFKTGDYNFPEINPGIAIVGPDGEFYLIYIDPNGDLKTMKLPIRIYYYVEPRTVYFEGETVDLTGTVVHAVYNDGSEVDVTSQCTFEPAQGTTVGTQGFNIVATYTVTAPTSGS